MAPSPNIERLYDGHAPALFAFLLNLLRNEADTYDVMQELFIKLGRRPALLLGVREERGFLLRMAHNAAIDLIRQRDARERNYSQFARQPMPLFAQSADPDERIFREKLAEALGELPRDWRAEILAAAAGSRPSGHTLNGRASRFRIGSRLESGRSSSIALPEKISGLTGGEGFSTWPSLRAWAGLAAMWVVIFLLHLTAPDEPRLARSSSPMTLQSFAMLHEQTLIMAQLLGQTEQPDAEQPRIALPAPPKPRSEIARKQFIG